MQHPRRRWLALCAALPALLTVACGQPKTAEDWTGDGEQYAAQEETEDQASYDDPGHEFEDQDAPAQDEAFTTEPDDDVADRYAQQEDTEDQAQYDDDHVVDQVEPPGDEPPPEEDPDPPAEGDSEPELPPDPEDGPD